MATFQPWIGNFNPTEHGKNEYIRLLKEALTDIDVDLDATLGVTLVETEAGSYSGTGTSSKVVSLSNTIATPKAVIIVGDDSGSSDTIFAISFNSLVSSSGKAYIFSSLGGTESSAVTNSRVTAFSVGSFTVAGTSGTGLNISGWNYFWACISNYLVD